MIQRSQSRDITDRNLRSGNYAYNQSGFDNKEPFNQANKNSLNMKDFRPFLGNNKSPDKIKFNDENKKPSKSERISGLIRTADEKSFNGKKPDDCRIMSYTSKSKSKSEFTESTLPTNKSGLDIIKEKVETQLDKKVLLIPDKNFNEQRDQSLTNLPMLNRRAKSSPKDGLRKANNEEKSVIRGVIPYVNDVDTWLKRNKLPPNTKVFIISNAYQCIRDALVNRGWIENPGFESNCFHFKYTLKSRDLGLDQLLDNQIVNHFSKASNITTKVGLAKTLKNCIWNCSSDPDFFFPRCYDANEESDYADFNNYYKLLRTECYLKKFVMYLRDNSDTLDRESEEYMEKIPRLEVAINVNRRRLQELGDYLFTINKTDGDNSNLTEKEWEMFSKDEMNEADLLKIIQQENIERFKKKHWAGNLKKKKKKKKPKKTIDKSDDGINNHNNALKPTDFTQAVSTNYTDNLNTQGNEKKCIGSDMSEEDGEDEEKNDKKKLSTENRPEIEVQAIE